MPAITDCCDLHHAQRRRSELERSFAHFLSSKENRFGILFDADRVVDFGKPDFRFPIVRCE